MVQIDIDMPATCRDCIFAGYDLSLIGARWCPFLREKCITGSRLDDCPLIEVRKGKWLEREVHGTEEFDDIGEFQSAKCSVCGRYHTTPYLYYFHHYNYCP